MQNKKFMKKYFVSYEIKNYIGLINSLINWEN